MKLTSVLCRWVLVAFVLCTPAYGVPGKVQAQAEKGRAAYLEHNYRKAEKHFRALIESEPSNWLGQLYLGHSLYYQGQYAEAIPPYERAMELGVASGQFELADQRLLTDQLGMAYGISGRLDDAKKLFLAGIEADPDYALYYYNLACTHAELGQLDDALENITLGFERRHNMLPGETYPNPRTDDSFKKYLGNEKFEATMKELGY